MGVGLGAGPTALTGCIKPTAHGDGPDANSLPEVAGAQRPAYWDAPSHWIDVAPPTAVSTTAANEINRSVELTALIHGGFWRDTYGADLMKPLACDLLERGHPVANLEYRRLGGRRAGSSKCGVPRGRRRHHAGCHRRRVTDWIDRTVD